MSKVMKMLALSWLLLILLPVIVMSQVSNNNNRYVNTDYGFSIQPPEEWTGVAGQGATVVTFKPKDSASSSVEFNIIYAKAQTPITLNSYIKKLKDFNKEAYRDLKTISEKELTVSNLKAFQIAIEYKVGDKERGLIQTVVSKSPMVFYSLDITFEKADYDKLVKVYNDTVATFAIEVLKLTDVEAKAQDNTLQVLNALTNVNKELFSENWYAICFVAKNGESKIGYYHHKTTEAEVSSKKGYLVETELFVDAGGGGNSRTITRGSFSFDFKTQKVEREETITLKDGNKLVNKLSGEMERGEAALHRNINGEQDDITIKVSNGILFTDAAELFRKILLTPSKKDYLIKYLYMAENSPSIDFLEVAGKDWSDELKKDVYLVYSKRDRKQSITILYDSDRNMIKESTANSPIIIKAVSKEEALK